MTTLSTRRGTNPFTTPIAATDQFVVNDEVATFAELGGLEYVASGDAAISAAVGKLYYVDVGSFTVDRVLTLPATAAVGQRVGVFVSTGDDTYELGIQANTGDTLNGVAAATDWSRLFITNECVIMRCVVADTTWIVEYDGRIPCVAYESDLSVTISGTSYTEIAMSSPTTIINIGDCWGDSNRSGNGAFKARRDGRINMLVIARLTTVTADLAYGLRPAINGSGGNPQVILSAGSTYTSNHTINLFHCDDMSDGQEFNAQVYVQSGTVPGADVRYLFQEVL